MVRVKNGDSPFKADRQHIHHLLLNLVKGHHRITAGILIIFQITVILLFENLVNIKSHFQIMVVIALFVLYFLSAYFLTRKTKKNI